MNIKEKIWNDANNTFTMLGTAKDIAAPIRILALLMKWWDVPSSNWTPYIVRINKIRTLSGTPYTVKWNKTVRLCFTRWICGHPLKDADIPTYADGFPKPLRHIRELCCTSRGKALTLTMLTWSRALQASSKPDLSPITKPYTGEWQVDQITDSVKAFARWAGNRPSLQVKMWKWWHLSTKSGPNGHAITSWADDLSVINLDDIKAFKVLAGEGMVTILSQLKFLINKPDANSTLSKILKLTKLKTPRKAKITWIKDKELKIRSVGIGNYWYQSSLMGIHDSLMDFLSRVPEDITFHQGDCLKVLRKPEGHSYWSLDLTTATDRFPLWFQKHIISQLFNEEIANAWCHLMSPTFHTKYGEIRYEVGQPMGFYSSWAAFAVSHHFVVYIAAKRAGLRSHRGLYVLLGDDIVIAHDSLAKEYRYIIGQIGVEMSESKTHTSEHSFEFAKRWYHVSEQSPNGMEEISPFPIHAVSIKAKYTDVLAMTLKGIEKSWSFTNPVAFMASANCILWCNLGTGFYERSIQFLDLYNCAADAALGRGEWVAVLRRIGITRRSISPVPSSFAHFADEVVQLVLKVIFVSKGLGKLALATEKGNSFMNSLIPAKVDPSSPFKGIWKILMGVPQVHVFSQIVCEFSRTTTLQLQHMYEGKQKQRLVSLMVTDLDTLMTTRTQQLNWTVLSKTVKSLSIVMDRVSQVGLSFENRHQIPDSLLGAIIRPLQPEDLALVGRYIDDDSRLAQLWSRGTSLNSEVKLDPTKMKANSVFRRLNYLTEEGKISSYLYGESG